jgi:putative transposase
MDRTVRIQLHPTPEQAKALRETLQQFTAAFNAVCAYGWQRQEKNGVRLHHSTYYATKETCPGLVSDLLIQARVKATETLKSAIDRKRKGRKVSQPRSRLCPVRYNEKTYTLHWETSTIRLSTCSGKVSIPFTVPPFSTRYQGYRIATADLCCRKGKYWLYVVVSVPEPAVSPVSDVVGVDLGLNHPAVTSTRQFLGNRHWKEVDRRRFRLRRALQSKGTRSARRHLKKLSGKSARFHRDCNHVLSKRIIANSLPGSTIVIENLKHIRSTSKIRKKGETKRRLHSWSFAQFQAFLVYKAQERGIRVERIDPRHTSQTCSRCGHQHRSNRQSQSLFLCKQCGYCLNADLNAAYNIREKHLASVGTSFAGALPSSSVSSPSHVDEGQAPGF